mmetsp:Transcript_3427/g.7726  ORF Transcript_3427/g.7726 Transcript_3427/m.7726 type:complete len:400 (+) Transcript_3427:159-1358(+)
MRQLSVAWLLLAAASAAGPNVTGNTTLGISPQDDPNAGLIAGDMQATVDSVLHVMRSYMADTVADERQWRECVAKEEKKSKKQRNQTKYDECHSRLGAARKRVIRLRRSVSDQGQKTLKGEALRLTYEAGNLTKQYHEAVDDLELKKDRSAASTKALASLEGVRQRLLHDQNLTQQKIQELEGETKAEQKQLQETRQAEQLLKNTRVALVGNIRGILSGVLAQRRYVSGNLEEATDLQKDAVDRDKRAQRLFRDAHEMSRDAKAMLRRFEEHHYGKSRIAARSLGTFKSWGRVADRGGELPQSALNAHEMAGVTTGTTSTTALPKVAEEQDGDEDGKEEGKPLPAASQDDKDETDAGKEEKEEQDEKLEKPSEKKKPDSPTEEDDDSEQAERNKDPEIR